MQSIYLQVSARLLCICSEGHRIDRDKAQCRSIWMTQLYVRVSIWCLRIRFIGLQIPLSSHAFESNISTESARQTHGQYTKKGHSKHIFIWKELTHSISFRSVWGRGVQSHPVGPETQTRHYHEITAQTQDLAVQENVQCRQSRVGAAIWWRCPCYCTSISLFCFRRWGRMSSSASDNNVF